MRIVTWIDPDENGNPVTHRWPEDACVTVRQLLYRCLCFQRGLGYMPIPYETALAEFVEVHYGTVSDACVWTEDSDGNWETECENLHILLDGAPADNQYTFCPYCGLPIQSVEYVPEPVEDEDEGGLF